MSSLSTTAILACWLAPALGFGAITIVETSPNLSATQMLISPSSRAAFTSLEDIKTLEDIIALQELKTKQDLTLMDHSSHEVERPAIANPAALLGPTLEQIQTLKSVALARSRRLISARAFARAEQEANNVLADDADATQALLLRGVAKAGQGKHQEAMNDFDRVLDLGQDDAALRQSRAVSLQALKRNEEAETEFTRAIEHDSKLAQAFLKRGALRGSMGRFEEAAADFSRFIDLRPNSPIGYRNRSLALIKLGRQADAQPDIIRARKLQQK